MQRGVHEVGHHESPGGGEKFHLYWRGFGHGIEVEGGPMAMPPTTITRIAANASDARDLARACCKRIGVKYVEHELLTEEQRRARCAQFLRSAFDSREPIATTIARRLRRTRKWVARVLITTG